MKKKHTVEPLLVYGAYVLFLLSSDMNCVQSKANEPSSSSEDTSEREPTAKPNYYYKYNHRIMDFNGTMRKHFAMEVLLRQPSNFVVSPLAAMLPIGQLYFGGNGAAKREIEDAFGLGYADEIQRVLYHALSNPEKIDGIDLNIALFMLLPKFNEVTKEFKDKITKLFQFNLQYVDFENKAQVADYTNYMFKVLTGGVTDKIITADKIESNSSLVVFNTCIFKGNWSLPFEDLDNFVFKSEFGVEKKVHGYRLAAHAKYTLDNTLEAEIVQINFKSDEACFLIVLPKQSTSLRSVMAAINSDPLLLQNAVTNMSAVKAQITLPKFQMDVSVDLKVFYMQVGVLSIFQWMIPSLTKLLVRDYPWVTSIRQVIKFRLRNSWVAASADDAGLLAYRSLKDLRKKYSSSQRFAVNRPFLFYVLHKGEQLFAGTVYDP